MAPGKLSAFRLGRILNSYKNVKSRPFHTYSTELGFKIPNKEPVWTTAKEVMEKCLKSDQTVYVQGAAATPVHLLEVMADRGLECCLENIMVCHMHTEGNAKFASPEHEGIFRSFSFFMGGNVRKAVGDGRADCLPIFLHEIPMLFKKKIIKPDLALIHVSPPDNHGYCSLGTSVDCARSACMNAKVIIAQVNPQMPRTFGDALIHSSHIDYAVCVDVPMPEHGGGKLGEVDKKIGDIIAENLIEDGATLQMGIGAIPDAVLSALHDHKNLGIHSEMFADGVVDLVEKGCVTNSEKKLSRGRTVGSFLNGTKKLYDFVDDNPSVEMMRVNYVNETKVISQMPKMSAINSAIEVDLTGQVNADSIGTRMFSGFGGQVDFIRGAAEGFDGRGKPIIALPSITKKNESKITPILKPGAGVVTSRAHVHYVVTEYGIAQLFGRSLRQRAHALIQIAHPDHREKLEKAAFERLKCMPSP